MSRHLTPHIQEVYVQECFCNGEPRGKRYVLSDKSDPYSPQPLPFQTLEELARHLFANPGPLPVKNLAENCSRIRYFLNTSDLPESHLERPFTPSEFEGLAVALSHQTFPKPRQ